MSCRNTGIVPAQEVSWQFCRIIINHSATDDLPGESILEQVQTASEWNVFYGAESHNKEYIWSVPTTVQTRLITNPTRRDFRFLEGS